MPLEGEPELRLADHREAIESAASAFVLARRHGRPMAAFPGPLPVDLDIAYEMQLCEIELWRDAIAGWKVGRLSPELADRYGVDRFLGPIFRKSIRTVASVGQTIFPVIAGGFAAFEAEFLLTLDVDVDPRRDSWTVQDAAALVGSMHIGVEIAGSPLRTINALGSIANVAGFGNNLGLIVGAEIPDWRGLAEADLICSTMIDGQILRTACAADLPGGLMTGFAFALNQAARLDVSLTAGTIISAGAITGVHAVEAGQCCTADFGDLGTIDCVTVPIVR